MPINFITNFLWKIVYIPYDLGTYRLWVLGET